MTRRPITYAETGDIFMTRPAVSPERHPATHARFTELARDGHSDEFIAGQVRSVDKDVVTTWRRRHAPAT